MASPMGVLLGMTITEISSRNALTAVVLRSFCAGLFLFVSLVELVPEELESRSNTGMKLCMLTVGFVFMAVMAAIERA